MRKGLSVLICFTMMVSLFGFKTVNAEYDTDLVLFEDFENEDISYLKGSSVNAEAYVNRNPFGNEKLYGKSLRWDLALYDTLKTYNYDIESKDERGVFLRASDRKNLYATISFDIATIGTDKRPLYISFMNGKANKNHLRIIFQSGRVYLNTTAVADRVDGITYSDSEVINIQVVEQFSDESGNNAEKIKAIYINGINILDGDMAFYEAGCGDNFSRIRLMCAKKYQGEENLTLGCYIDNLMITKHSGYNAELCKKRYELLELLQEAISEKLSENLIEGGISVYKNPLATEKELENAAKGLQNHLFAQQIKLKDFELDLNSNELSGFIFGKDSSDERNFNAYIAAYKSDKFLESCGVLKTSDSSDASVAEFSNGAFEIPTDYNALKLYLWGDAFEPLTEPIELSQSALTDWEVYVNNELIYPDTPVCVDIKSKTFMIPIKNFLNNMGIELENNGTAYLANSPDGKSVILYENSDKAIMNGKALSLSNPTYLKDNAVLIAPIDVLSDAFGADIEVNEAEHRIDVFYTLSESYNNLPNSIKLNCSTGYSYVDYSISGISSSAKVEVFYKLKQRNTKRVESLVFQKAVTPQVIEGKFVGAIGNLRHNHHYDLLIKVSDVSGTKYYLKEYAFLTKEIKDSAYEDMISVGENELKLVPTYENLSYYLNATANSCKIKYKKATSDEWKEAYSPYKDPYVSDSFRGSIVGLESNCEYDVKAELYDEGGSTIGEITQSVTTWNDSPPVAKTVKLSEIYSGGSLMIASLKGSESGWIKIVNDTGIKISGDSRCPEAVLVSDCEYLILEGFKITSAMRHGINVTGSVKNIIIKDADISGFGRVGVYNEEKNQYLKDGDYIDHDSGIYVCDAEKVTIDNCYIHDCRAYTNDWGKNATHPFGGVGICVRLAGQGVIRNNRIIGNSEHMWNDAIEGLGNADRNGGVCKDTDIYNNIFSGCNDDSTELDGGAMNIRFYNNQVYDTYSGISLTPVLVGPVYMFNNLIIAQNGVKSGGAKDNMLGMRYLFNNTVVSVEHNLRNTGINGSSEYHTVTRNNIFFSAKGASIYNANVDSRDSNRNDVIWGKMLKINASDKPYEIFAIPDFDINYSLSKNSVGKGASEWINNFNEYNDKDIGCDTALLK